MDQSAIDQLNRVESRIREYRGLMLAARDAGERLKYSRTMKMYRMWRTRLLAGLCESEKETV